MFINKRPYQVNHIQNKVNYIYLKRNKNYYIPTPKLKSINNKNITESPKTKLLYNEDKNIIPAFSLLSPK